MYHFVARPQFKGDTYGQAVPEQRARLRQRAPVRDRNNFFDSCDLAALRQENAPIGRHGSPQWSPVVIFIMTPTAKIIPEAPARKRERGVAASV